MIVFRNFAILAVFLLASIASFAQSPTDIDARVRAATEAQDWASARSEIERLRAANPTLFKTNGYDYLLGRVALADQVTIRRRFLAGIGLLVEWHRWGYPPT